MNLKKKPKKIDIKCVVKLEKYQTALYSLRAFKDRDNQPKQ